ncbi:MAG: gfo/Idh/MocA family oxidoreductase, partial [Anaerolineae bacterium]|nr:gfo/Idh/MocA family oxidoreductase [Anaerolineae bacterium]
QAQAIIQGSWNWPFGRKDMEVYGQTGYVIAADAQTLRIRFPSDREEETVSLPARGSIEDDPFTYLAAVVRDGETLVEGNLWSLSNNMLVVEILDAARESARTGQTIKL